MSVSGVASTHPQYPSSTAQAAAAESTAGKDLSAATSQTGLDYNAFLKLLVAEMSNQDPLNPTNSTEYIAQFASFSNVEQSITTNKKLDSLMAVSALTQANSLIGRTATSADGTKSGQVSAVRIAEGGVEAVLEDGSAIALEPGALVE